MRLLSCAIGSTQRWGAYFTEKTNTFQLRHFLVAGPCSPRCKCYLQTSLLAVGGCSKQAFLLWHRDILQQPLLCAAAIWKSEQGRSWASKKRLMQPVTNTVVHSLWLIPAVHARGLSSAANPLLLGSPCWLTRLGRPRCLPCAAGETSPGWPRNTTVKCSLHLPLPCISM